MTVGMRSPVTVRAAATADIPDLVELTHELRRLGGRAERAAGPPVSGDVAARLADLMTAPDARVVAACVLDRPAGMAVLRVVRNDPLSDSLVLQVSHLVVAVAHRHCGIGRALVQAAAEFAIERHVDYLDVGLYPSLRDASRFYARLGFGPAEVHRVAPVTVLRRRLAVDVAPPILADGLRRRTRRFRTVPPQRAKRDRQRT